MKIDVAFKIFVILCIFYITSSLVQNYQLYETAKQNTQEHVDRELKSLNLLKQKLFVLKSKERTKEVLVTKNRIDIPKYRAKLEALIKEVNTNSEFSSKLVSIVQTKTYLNVAVATISVVTKFKNFGITTFSEILRNEFASTGYVLPLKIVNDKRAFIKIILLDPKGDLNEKN